MSPAHVSELRSSCPSFYSVRSGFDPSEPAALIIQQYAVDNLNYRCLVHIRVSAKLELLQVS